MKNIREEQNGAILLLTIDRPKAMNALNRQTLDDLKEILEGIDPAVTRCAVITGAGDRAFVAGADIAEMRDMSMEQAKEFSVFGNSVLRALETLPIPVIAAVNGYALGGGCELALACDIRIAAESAVFAQPEVTLGIPAGFGGTQRLARIVGEQWAKRLLYTAVRIKAPQALEIGLVSEVCPAAELMQRTMRLAETIAANAPLAVSATKRAMAEGCGLDMDKAIAVEAEHFSSCFESWDQVEGMSALLEKRAAQPFRG